MKVTISEIIKISHNFRNQNKNETHAKQNFKKIRIKVEKNEKCKEPQWIWSSK
jgi:hypothetical protein